MSYLLDTSVAVALLRNKPSGVRDRYQRADVLIAGQALRGSLTLVTANVSEFSRVPDLRWEDWAA